MEAKAAGVSDQRAKDIVTGLGDAAPSEADRHASQVMVDALRTHRAAASGAAAVPENDAKLSSQLMAEARTRSQEIRAAAQRPDAGRPIPGWLWLAWLAAIALLAAGWYWLA